MDDDTQDQPGRSATLDGLLSEARSQLAASEYIECGRTAEQALEAARELDLPLKVAEAANILGSALLRIGMTEQALPLFNESLDIGVEHRNDELRASSLTNLGRYYRLTGNSDLALRHGREGVEAARLIDSPLILASAILSLGNICERTGRYSEALDLYTEALSIAKSTGDQRLEAYAAGNVGIIHERLGETHLSLHYNIRSLELKEAIDDRWGMGVSYNNVAILYHDLGEYPNALESWMKSLEITEAIGDREGVSAALNGIGMMLEAMDDRGRVMEFYTRSLSISRQIGYAQGEAFSLNHIGRFYLEQDDHTRALLYFQRSFRLFESTGDRYGMRGLLQSIGEVYAHMEDQTRALDCFARGLAIARETGDRIGQCSILQAEGSFLVEWKDFEGAIDALEPALDIARSDGYRELERKILTSLAVACDQTGRPAEGVVHRRASAACTDALFNERTRRRTAELLFHFQANDVARLGRELGLSDEDIRSVLEATPRKGRSQSNTGERTSEAQPLAPSIRAEVLGRFRLTMGDRELQKGDWGRRRARDLFAFLLLRHRRPVTTDDIIERFLREERSDSKTRMLVMNAVSHVRRALEPGRAPHTPSSFLLSEGGCYILDLGPDSWIDFLRFKELIVDARRATTLPQRLDLYEQALELYRGDLFAEDPYSDWSASERDMLRDAWLEGVEYVAAEHLRAGRLDEAIDLARRGLQADPTGERSCEILTTALTARGRSGEAQAVREAFDREWTRDYGTPRR